MNGILLIAAAAFGIGAVATAEVANADTVSIDFTASQGVAGTADPVFSFTLEPNGTVFAQVSVSAGSVIDQALFAYPAGSAVASMTPISPLGGPVESGFSSSIYIPAGSTNTYGNFDGGVGTKDPSPSTYSSSLGWIIGTPGDYTSVYQALTSNASGFAAYVLTAGNESDQFAGVIPAVPLPAGAWLMLSGIVGLGVMARRRRAEPVMRA
jgi:hypothetical protein